MMCVVVCSCCVVSSVKCNVCDVLYVMDCVWCDVCIVMRMCCDECDEMCIVCGVVYVV